MHSEENLLETADKSAIGGEYEKAKELYSTAIAYALNQRGIVQRMLGNYKEAREDFKAAFDASPDDEQKALAYINCADISRVFDADFEGAHDLLDKALLHASVGSLASAKAKDQRGLVFVAEEDYDEAIHAYEGAKAICEDLRENQDKEIDNRFAQVLSHLGVAYFLRGNPDDMEDAENTQSIALDIFKSLGDKQGIVNTVATIGKLAQLYENYDKAVSQYQYAYNILKETNEERGIATLAFHLAEAYLYKDEPELAQPYLEEFKDGVIKGKLTDLDISMLKDRFETLEKIYDLKSFNIDRFDDVLERFEQK